MISQICTGPIAAECPFEQLFTNIGRLAKSPKFYDQRGTLVHATAWVIVKDVDGEIHFCPITESGKTLLTPCEWDDGAWWEYMGPDLGSVSLFNTETPSEIVFDLQWTQAYRSPSQGKILSVWKDGVIYDLKD
jgi:hypothetical protein